MLTPQLTRIICAAALLAPATGLAADAAPGSPAATPAAADAKSLTPSDPKTARPVRSSWELSPYRIQLYIRFDPELYWSAQQNAELVAKLIARAQVVVGGFWQLEGAEAPAEMHWARSADLASVTSDAFPATALDRDKVLLLSIGPGAAGEGYRVRCREFDVRTGLWNAMVTRTVPQPAELVDESVRLAWEAFSPVVRIESGAKQEMTVRLRGGAMPLASRGLEPLRDGMVFRPVVRHFDAQGQTVKGGVFNFPWCWLVVERVDGSTATCQWYGGTGDPPDLHLDGRTEYLGLEVAPVEGTTELTVRSRDSQARPLEGLDVFARNIKEKISRRIGSTDQHGTVTIPASPGALELITIEGNEGSLARLPMVPGLEPLLTASLEDTGRRLEAASFVAHVRRELVDLVARQQLLAIRTGKQITDRRLDEAEKSLAELKGLPDADTFLNSVSAERHQLSGDAVDAATGTWLDKRLEEMKPLVATYLDAQAISQLQTQLAAAKNP